MPLRVLLLEDSEADAELVKAAIERAGMKAVFFRADSRDAFAAALREFEPDVVLSDHSLAQFSGLAALEVIRAIRPAAPLIVVSGTTDERTTVACVRAGAEDVVLKGDLQRLAASRSKRPLKCGAVLKNSLRGNSRCCGWWQRATRRATSPAVCASA